MKHLLIVISLILFAASSFAQKVISIKIDGSINPASAAFIHDAIEKAKKQNAACLLIHLNTPGGLLKSTRIIVSDILESPIPIVVYVSPGGAHAGSAGVFITVAAHVAAMAPGTNIGAAHPVNMQGGTDSVMNDKATNDAVAFIKSVAAKRNRNAQWAEEAVRKSVSLTETEALTNKVIDIVANNERQLLTMIDGRKVEVIGGSTVLKTRAAEIVNVEMSFVEKLLNLLSDPNIAYILLMIGFYGILFELYNPGALFPGIAGGICLILAFYSMHTLPVNYAGVALIVFALILFLLEIKIVSHGLLGIGGVISLLLGSLMLIRSDVGFGFIHISWVIILTTTAITALFFLFIVGMGVKAQRLKPATGVEALIGETGEALVTLSPVGSVHVHGEVWNAEAVSGRILQGQKVKVTSVSGLKVFVEEAGNPSA